MRKIKIGTSLSMSAKTSEIYNRYKDYFTVENEGTMSEKYVICREPSEELLKEIEEYYAEATGMTRAVDEFVDYVAADVLEHMSQKDREYIYQYPSSLNHRLSMGIGIMARYMLREKLPFSSGHMGVVSVMILQRIASLIIENYDYENFFYHCMYEDATFNYNRRIYFALEGKYPDDILEEYADRPDERAAAKECRKRVRKAILNSLKYMQKAKEAGLSEEQALEFKHYVNKYNKTDWKIIPYDIGLLRSKKLQEDERKILLGVLAAVLNEQDVLIMRMPKYVFNQKDAVILAVSICGKSLQRFTRFNQDDEVIRTALANTGEAIQYVHKSLRDNDEYLRLALSSKCGDTLKMRCMAKYRDNEEYVKIALEVKGGNIMYASKRIRDDIEIAKFAVVQQNKKHTDSVVCNLSRRLRDNDEVAKALITSGNTWEMQYMSKRIQKLYGDKGEA